MNSSKFGWHESHYLCKASRRLRECDGSVASTCCDVSGSSILGIRDITVHDLRRTAGSHMARLGVPKEVRQGVLNHGGLRKGDVTDAVYAWYDFDDEKRAALELWADTLDCIIEGQAGEIDNFHTRLARLKGVGTVRVN